MRVQTSPPSLAPLRKEGNEKIEKVHPSLFHRRWVRIGWLAIVTSLLLAQFIVRVHNPGAMAGFIDEYRHISRAQAAYQFDQNPIEFSHGKLLLYYWLGLFDPSGGGALVTSRLAIALVSLITSAAIVAVTRTLFGKMAAIPALIFYVVVPHAVFYERLALADPLAGALAAVTVWQCIILVRRPTRRRGVAVGLLIGATTMAKLTTALILGLPVISVIVLGSLRPRRRTVASIRAWSGAVGKRYRPALNAVRYINAFLWLTVGATAYLSYRAGAKPAIIDLSLLGLKVDTPHTFGARFSTLYEIVKPFVSEGMALTLLALAVFMLIRRPRSTLFVLIWLALLIAPSILIAWKVDARYLLIGQPALAVLFGSGVTTVGDELSRFIGPAAARYKVVPALPAVVLLGIWGALFAIPFDWNAMHDPAALEMPPITRYIFFAGPVNAWGTREAINYLEKHAEPGPIPTVAVLHTIPQVPDLCDLFTLYLNSRFEWKCRVVSDSVPEPMDARQWPELLTEDQPVIYVISDLLSPDSVPDSSWQLMYSKQRPQGGKTVSLWRVALAGHDAKNEN